MTPAGTSNELDVQNKWEENMFLDGFLVVVCTAMFLFVKVFWCLPAWHPVKCHEEVLFSQPTKRFDIFPLCVGINAQKV